jgi:hypothetical protein
MTLLDECNLRCHLSDEESYPARLPFVNRLTSSTITALKIN